MLISPNRLPLRRFGCHFAAIVLLLLAPHALGAPARNVLVLHSYNVGNAWTDNLQEGLEAGLREQAVDVDLHLEYMDTKRHDPAELAEPFEALLRTKYGHLSLHALVVSDNNALEFIAPRRDRLFPGVPLVFVGINNYASSAAKGGENMTGIVEEADIVGTLGLMLQAQPDLKRICVVADVVPSARLHLAQFREAVGNLGDAVEIVELLDMTVSELSAELQAQPPDTAVVLLSYYRDREGHRFEASESARFISSFGLPVYSFWDIYMGHGVTGGSMTSGRVHGKMLAGMLCRVLAGEPVGSVAVVHRSPSVPMFDWSAMRRYDISRRSLPRDTIVVGEPQSALYQHRHLVVTVAIFVLLQAAAILFLMRTVARRKQAEEALRRSEARFRAITENTSELTLIIDGHGYVTYVSPASRPVAGLDPSDVLGRLASGFVHPDDLRGLEETVTRLRRGEGVIEHMSDFRLRHANGHWVHLAGLFTNMLEVAEVGAIVVNCRDISDRVEAEEALRRQAVVFNTINDAVVVSDSEGRIANWNRGAALLFGYGSEDAVGRGALFFLHEAPAGTQAEIDRALDGERVWRGELAFRRSDGKQGVCEAVIVPLERPGQAAAGRIAVARDITPRRTAEEQRRRLEQQVQQSQKLESLGVLAGGIAHDFNNLLMGILGQADLALMDVPASSPARHSLLEIEKASRKAADLSRQMLAYSGKGRFIVEPLSLNEIVDEMAHLLDVSVSKKTTLQIRLAKDLPPVDADAAQMRQVLVNLVANASEALEEREGTVLVSTGAMQCDQAYLATCRIDRELPAGRYVFLEVSDTGMGMDPDTQARIFDPFFTTRFTGRGLGLAAVLGIVRGHRGAIRVYSEPRRGSTFKVLLPASDEKAPVQMAARASSHSRPRSAGTVLLVDDEPTVRDVGRGMLERAGFEVVTACDGRDGIEAFRAHAPHIACVLLDLTMPVMDGEEAYRHIRALSPDVCVIVSSGYSEHEVAERFRGKGIAGFVQKPYQSADLLRTIHEALGTVTG